ncbi:shikimate dehydrogenase [Kushneria sinocarnis]|uniref:Shikimate dehydrogenase n=1 Tax=Kushneria sinocarnis TaxID=595502 RepID=A0A420WWD3_9GAMM|nr:saccharopine dehydrogenase NADP-binding domain-containing protein [Kushneria sinocarnis]RKR03424.1 shikimate dehydrogenase [Kushneria sinocarnis]
MIKLGLIGQGIRQSRSPDLHERLGRLVGQPVQYDIVEAGDQTDFSLSRQLDTLRAQGYRGTNITYPFKEQALNFADRVGEGARRVGATNTLIFEGDRISAENTDFTGFISAWRFSFADRQPDEVIQIGAGGVGRAVAHGLAQLGALSISIVDTDSARAHALADELGSVARVTPPDRVSAAIRRGNGLVNCSPVGHVDHPGCPIDPSDLHERLWIFDAVYTPPVTQLVQCAMDKQIDILSGVDLFLFQGVDAFKFFIGESRIKQDIDREIPELRRHYHSTSGF